MIQPLGIAEAADRMLNAGFSGTRKLMSNRIRSAAARGAIDGASKGVTGRWYFNMELFDKWLAQIANEKRGRPRK